MMDKQKNRYSRPIVRLLSKDGNLAIYPKMEKTADGYKIKNPSELRSILGYDKKEQR